MEQVLLRIQEMFAGVASQAYVRFVDIVPEALLAILIIVIGWLVASLVYFLTIRILQFFAIDKLAGKTPLDRVLRNVGIHKSIAEILGLLVFWLAILVTLIFASDVLHLEQVSYALTVVTRFIPQVIAAILIIIGGMLLARFLQVIIVQALRRAEIGYEQSIGKAVHITVLIFVILAAIQQLGLNLSFITTNVVIFFAAMLVIVGVGFVVSARSILENWMACRQLRHLVFIGDHIQIEDTEGTVTGFTPTAVRIKGGNGEHVVPAVLFTSRTYVRSASDGGVG